MSRDKTFTIFLLLTIILTFPFTKVLAQAKSASPEVSVSIGEYEFFLFGYTSPRSLVTIEGVGIFDQTYSDTKGYFRFSPFYSREPCLSSQDQLGRVSNTICIPPFPLNRSVHIGPVILPPTVYLNKDVYFVGDQIVLSGQAIPNTDVDLSFFIDQNRTPIFSFVKPAYAVSLPRLKAKSDGQGNYAILLPSSQADYFRIFAQDKFQENDSPRSNTLAVKVLPWWMIIIETLRFIWDLLRSRLFELIILTQIAGLLYFLFRRYLQPYVIAHNRALVLREKHPLLVTDHELILREVKR